MKLQAMAFKVIFTCEAISAVLALEWTALVVASAGMVDDVGIQVAAVIASRLIATGITRSMNIFQMHNQILSAGCAEVAICAVEPFSFCVNCQNVN